MNTKNFGSLSAGCALMLLAVATQVSAQQPAKPSVSLSGVWLTSGPYGSRPQSEWSNEELPFTPKGRAMFDADKPGKGPRQIPPARGNDPIGGANPPGLYRTLIYPRPFELVQFPDKVIQLFEWGRVWRTIYTDGRPVPAHISAGPYWYGYSVGKWEGDTLAVTTMALDERAWFDEWGLPIGPDTRVEERWQRVTPDKLQLKITVHDPATYARPWSSFPVMFNLKHGYDPQEIIMSPMDENTFNERIRNPAGLPAK